MLPGRLVCFSPECFVRITDGVIRSYPMKGTIDAALPDAEARLLEDYKERCEHYTIVDLIRNDLNRIADRVRVERFRYVEKIATLRGEILQTSSVSRATLLRLEKRGLVSPAFIDPESGYRYFDNHDITRILQIRHLLTIGLSYDEIHEYFATNGTSEKLLVSLKQRMYATQRMYEEMSLRILKKESLTFETVSLPKYVCYSREYRGGTAQEKYTAMYALYHEAIENGLRPLASEPLFTINKSQGLFGEKEDAFICCIPLEPDNAPARRG